MPAGFSYPAAGVSLDLSLVASSVNSHSTVVDSCDAVAVAVTSDGWLPRLTLRAPGGATYTIDDTSTALGVSYESDDAGTVALLRVASPARGNWSVDVQGTASLASEPQLGVAGVPMQVRAWVNNLGAAPGTDFVVVFRDSSTGDSLGAVHLSVASGDSAQASVDWVSVDRGEHRIAVEVESVGEFDPVTDNNLAMIVVPVSGPAPVLAAPKPAPSVRGFALSPPYPNPAHLGVTMDFALPQRAQVTIEVFDVQGRSVSRLVHDTLEPGTHSIHWDGLNRRGGRVSSGVYYVRMVAPRTRIVRTLVYML